MYLMRVVVSSKRADVYKMVSTGSTQNRSSKKYGCLLFILVVNSFNKCLLDSRHYCKSWGYNNE